MNEAKRGFFFPEDESELGKIAKQLKSPLEEDLFDETTRYDHLYLIVAIEKEESEFVTAHDVSSSFRH